MPLQLFCKDLTGRMFFCFSGELFDNGHTCLHPHPHVHKHMHITHTTVAAPSGPHIAVVLEGGGSRIVGMALSIFLFLIGMNIFLMIFSLK